MDNLPGLNAWQSSPLKTPVIGSKAQMNVGSHPAIQFCATSDPQLINRAVCLGEALWNYRFDQEEMAEEVEAPQEEPSVLGSLFSGLSSAVISAASYVSKGANDLVKDQVYNLVMKFWRLLRGACRTKGVTLQDFLTLVEVVPVFGVGERIYGKDWRESWPKFIQDFLKFLELSQVELNMYLIVFENQETMKFLWDLFSSDEASFTKETLAQCYLDIFLRVPEDDNTLIGAYQLKKYWDRPFLAHRFDSAFWEFPNVPLFVPTEATKIHPEFDFTIGGAESSYHVLKFGEAPLLEAVYDPIPPHLIHRYWCRLPNHIRFFFNQHFLGCFWAAKKLQWVQTQPLHSTSDFLKNLFDMVDAQWKTSQLGEMTCAFALRADLPRDLTWYPETQTDTSVLSCLPPEAVTNFLRFSFTDWKTLSVFRCVSKKWNLAVKTLCPTYQVVAVLDNSKHLFIKHCTGHIQDIGCCISRSEYYRRSQSWSIKTTLCWSGDVIVFPAMVEKFVPKCFDLTGVSLNTTEASLDEYYEEYREKSVTAIFRLP